MRKLHTATKSGFRSTLSPVNRQNFRSEADVEDSIILIPINFFLHNGDGSMSVDELVFQAVERNHSAQFDHLALFALHLNRVGSGHDVRSGREIVSRPAMWANEFVRERLWSNGAWQRDALTDESLDLFLSDRMNAQSNVRVKCRNNYRHLFELCKYLPTTLPMINTEAEQWIASALFLAWDRHILDGGVRGRSHLVSLVDSEDLYKFLGVSRDYTLAHAPALADLYESVGCLDRFREGAKLPPTRKPAPHKRPREVPEESGLEWLDQEESDGIVERREVERREQKRDRRKASALKRRYDNTCQFCGTRLEVGKDQHYSEAAHIKGLGEPHNGPDKVKNMLVLCPNHHLQFDRGVLRLIKVGTDYQIQSKTAGHPLNGRTITLKHSLHDDCVKHHHAWFN